MAARQRREGQYSGRLVTSCAPSKHRDAHAQGTPRELLGQTSGAKRLMKSRYPETITWMAAAKFAPCLLAAASDLPDWVSSTPLADMCPTLPQRSSSGFSGLRQQRQAYYRGRDAHYCAPRA